MKIPKLSSLEKQMLAFVIVFLVAVVYISYRVVLEVNEHGLEGIFTCIWKGGC